MLTGQHYRYLVRQLIDIAGGRRGNANLDMVEVITGYPARDVSVVADYVSRLNVPSKETGR
jgi:cytochrome c553